MKAGKPLAFILLAFVIGATVSQGSFAFADDSTTNPFRAIWDAIGELQVKTDSLQAQIDDLKSQQGTVQGVQTVTKISESSLAIEVAGGQSGQTLITMIAGNAGPDSAVGLKLTVFYQPSLFRVNFIQGAECSDGSRGIIECYLGTIPAGSEARVVVDATPILLDQRAVITADLSSITTDANLANNHAESVFITSMAPVEEEQVPQQFLTVQADKSVYVLGEPVTVLGNVGTAIEGLPVVIQVFNPNGEPYRFAQVNATSSATYSYTFNIGGDLAPPGQYRIVASYSGASIETTLMVVIEQPLASSQPGGAPEEQLPAEQSSGQPSEQESQESESTEQTSESGEGTGEQVEGAGETSGEGPTGEGETSSEGEGAGEVGVAESSTDTGSAESSSEGGTESSDSGSASSEGSSEGSSGESGTGEASSSEGSSGAESSSSGESGSSGEESGSTG